MWNTAAVNNTLKHCYLSLVVHTPVARAASGSRCQSRCPDNATVELKMRIDHVNIAFFVIFLSTSILWLIGKISGYGNVLFKGMPMLCLSLSLGFILTWWVVFKRLEIYGIIFAWMQEYLNVPKSIVSGKWRSVNWSNLLALLALAWPIRDMAVRWNIVQQRWSVAFPQYTEVFCI